MEQELRESPAVVWEAPGKVGWIHLNRPAARNGINMDLAELFLQAMAELAANDNVNVIVVAGRGKAFCAGGDLKAIQGLKTAVEAEAFAKKAGEMVEAIVNCPKPVIAMVSGAAAGAGFNLALACDLIFAAENANFYQSFSNIGLVPDCGGHYFLPRAIGIHWAKEVIFNAGPITAFQGLEYGFINEVFGVEVLQKETAAYAELLANKPQQAIRNAKRLLNRSGSMSLTEVLAEEARIQGELIVSEDCKEGIAAFFEKREPRFRS